MTVDPAPPARVSVLLDATDDVAVTAGLLARHDPAAGCVVVHPTPGGIGRVGLALDLLGALGRPVDALRADRAAGFASAWPVATAWVIGDCVEHLVVLRADRLRGDGWAELVQLSRASGAAVLLVCHTRTIAARLRARLPEAAAVFTDLHDAVRDLDRPRPAPEESSRRRYADLPRRLPTGQVTHYRADVHRQHTRETFARVDDLYGQGVDAACRWLRHRPRPAARKTRGADEALQSFLTELVHDSPTAQHALALLRGVQAGFLLHGSWLAVPGPGDLCGPGLTSTPVTFDVAERIRAAIAHPVLAAGVALTLFTGIGPLSLRSLRLDSLPPPGQSVLVPFHRLDVRKQLRDKAGGAVPRQSTLVCHIPVAARPLIRAARVFLLGHSPDPRQRVFASFRPVHERIEQAAARCGLTVPRPTASLIDAWLLRVHWSGLDEAVHTERPDPAGDGRSCLSARPAAVDPAGAAPLYRYPHDQLGKRWSPLNPPAFLPGLLRAFLDGTEPDLRGYREHENWNPPAFRDEDRRRGLVEEHLAVRVPPTGPEPSQRITLHPDIAFALRLADRPAGPYPDAAAQP